MSCGVVGDAWSNVWRYFGFDTTRSTLVFTRFVSVVPTGVSLYASSAMRMFGKCCGMAGGPASETTKKSSTYAVPYGPESRPTPAKVEVVGAADRPDAVTAVVCAACHLPA